MPPVDDLTARARIRDAALAEFGSRGFAGATIRGIAERAGFSPALVQHHFGTKDGLRTACDAHVLEYFREHTAAGIGEGRVGEASFIAEVYATSPPVVHYLARALVDGSPAAATVFDEMVELTERYLVDRPGLADARTRAIVFTGMRLGGLVLHDHVSRLLGADMFSGAAATRMGRATLDIVAPELLPEGLSTRIREALERYEEGEGR
ncbi:TetR/AcrR family transcriptional regulator [Allokutzneria sp. A3M-2-11 16]|uniref:TetR/AcrR family transcriptional regulator n=1 Tax=Allokutzneria sp. A3M-2-11 16 TaxID=2962043 RepID=UPI00273A72C0|nr:TetR family transcriptional regulator [Allokutzneria sp. A3M-2-11 16]